MAADLRIVVLRASSVSETISNHTTVRRIAQRVPRRSGSERSVGEVVYAFGSSVRRRRKPLRRRAPIARSRTPIRRKAKSPAERAHIAATREFVQERSRGACECCLGRRGQSMHERRFKSLGGEVSTDNSMWVCGRLGTGPECHGLLQRNEIAPVFDRGRWTYEAVTERARKWLEAGWKAFDDAYESGAVDAEASA